MRKNGTNQTDPNTLAILHRAGDTWRILIAKSEGIKPAILDTRDVAAHETEGLDDWFDEHHVGQALVVLPASSVVCRTCTLPDTDSEQLALALELQAEAQIASLAPAHRQAAAILHAAPDETTRCGIMIAWPESVSIELPATSRPIRMTSDVVALASLLDGERPASPLVWLDRNDGSLAIAFSHANGAVFRCTCEDGESNESWQRNVGRAIAETGMTVGHSQGFIDTVVQSTKQQIASLNGITTALFIPEEIISSTRARIDGTKNDAQWWSKYGVAVGAFLARFDQLKPLTEIESSPPVVKPSPIRIFLDAISQPKTAQYCVMLCLATLMFGPLLIHGLRLGILSLRYQDIHTQLRTVDQYKNQQEMYRELDKKAWPMIKLLSDLASNTPEGIELDSIRINFNESINVSGHANSHGGLAATEIIAQMQKDLDDTAIFSNTTLGWKEPNNFGQYEFSLSTKITRPYRQAKYDQEHDFALQTLQMRIDGVAPEIAQKNAGNAGTVTPPVAETHIVTPGESRPMSSPVLADVSEMESPTGASRARRTQSGGRDPAGNLSSRLTDRGPSGALPPSVDIPEPLTEGQIEAMSLGEAQAALGKVAEARRHGRIDKETELRLKKEFTLLIKAIGVKKRNKS